MSKNSDRKLRVTVTLSPRVVKLVDRAARRSNQPKSRSAIIDEWLLDTAQRQAKTELDRQIEAYYAGDDGTDAEEREAWRKLGITNLIANDPEGWK